MAAHLSSDLSAKEEQEVYFNLNLKKPPLKLLYITPEKLSASSKLIQTLQSLHNRKLLDRFVIDEAHCISQWGHDFRPVSTFNNYKFGSLFILYRTCVYDFWQLISQNYRVVKLFNCV